MHLLKWQNMKNSDVVYVANIFVPASSLPLVFVPSYSLLVFYALHIYAVSVGGWASSS